MSPLLCDILIQFREKRVALVGYIKKAFLNVEVSLRHRDWLRFLWVNNVDTDLVDPVVYRLYSELIIHPSC